MAAYIYGNDAIGSNVHNLCHVIDDVNRFGNLHEISTYEFENTLGHMKLWLRRCDKPLEQISRRVSELFHIQSQHWLDSNDSSFKPSVKYPFKATTTPNIVRYKEIDIRKNVILSSRKFGDKFFLTYRNAIVEMDHIIEYNNSFLLFGTTVNNLGNFFSEPLSSSHLNFFLSDGTKLDSHYYPIHSIKCKLLCLSYGEKSVFLPLLHSFD